MKNSVKRTFETEVLNFALAHKPNGLFDAHGIWAFGVQVMRRVNFASKAMIISLLFALPIGWLSWAYFKSQSTAIAFSLKERQGVVYLRAVVPVLEAALQLRESRLESISTATDKLETAYANLEAVQSQLGSILSTGSVFDELIEIRNEAKAQNASAGARINKSTEHVQALITLMTSATCGPLW
jgi:hypothetical protein